MDKLEKLAELMELLEKIANDHNLILNRDKVREVIVETLKGTTLEDIFIFDTNAKGM